MNYYKFNPRNHICSLTWTGIIFVSQLGSGTSFIQSTLRSAVMGIPAVFVGINIREKAEKEIRNKIVIYINTQKEVTVNQIISYLDLSGSHANEILTSLVKEDRIEIINRESDMKVIYIPTS